LRQTRAFCARKDNKELQTNWSNGHGIFEVVRERVHSETRAFQSNLAEGAASARLRYRM